MAVWCGRRRLIRGVAASVPLVMLAGLTAVAIPAAAAPAAPAARPGAGPGAGPEAEAASAEARRTGHRVEVTGLRSQTGQVFANPEGTFTSEEYAQPVRVRRADGSWVPVDLTLRRAADGSVVPVASPVDLRLSGGGTGAFAHVVHQGRAVALGWPDRLPAPVLAGDTATYPEVLPGVDLRVRATVGGFAEVLVVKDRAAAANPALRSVRFTTATHGVTLRSDRSGVLSAVDSAGRAVFTSGTAMMWDSSPARAVAEPRHAAMPVAVTPGGLTVTPDRALLSDPDTVYPVYVDPSVTVDTSYWTMVNQRHPDQSYWSYDRNQGAKVGYVEDAYDGWERYRSIFIFSTGSWSHKHVLGATFSANLSYSYYCTASRTDLWLVGGVDSSTTWNNKDDWIQDLDAVSNGWCNNGSIHTEWGSSALTSEAQTASTSWSSITLGLRAYNESTINTSWKKFDPATAKLSVTYNTPPNAPTNLTADTRGCVTGANRPYVGSVTPTLTAYVSDADSGSVLNAKIYWAPLGGTFPSPDYVAQSTVANNSTMVASVPSGKLVDGASYVIRAQSGDGTDTSPWSAQCEFTVDVTRPSAPPTVASADGIYVDDGSFHGGVGRVGSFTFGANGVGDVQSFLYGLADPPTTEVAATALGGTATVTVTPTAAGLTKLYVRSKDRAGNLSDIYRYTFLTGSATAPTALWAMNEGSGTTLNDSSGHGHPATLSGGTAWTAGRVGVDGTDSAVTFDGSTGYAATSGPVIDTSRSWAVAAWVRPSSVGPNFQTAVSAEGVHSSEFYLQYRKDTGNWALTMRNSDADGAPSTILGSGTAPVAGQWTHLAAVYDTGAGQVSLYVNGRLAGSKPFTTAWTATGPLVIGRARANSTSVDYFPGDIDDVRVWDRVVYADEISRLVTNATLVGWWSLDDGFGTTASDDSGYGHDVTLTTGAGWGNGRDGSGGLLTDGASGSAAASGPALRTDQSFTVAAWVRLTAGGHFATAVSQDGVHSSSFYLQFRPDVDRWAFIMRNADTDSAASTRASSTTVPQFGTWTHLVGEYDATNKQLRLYVNGQLEATTSFTTAWNATGPLAIGRAKTSSSLVDYFPGEIDEVRVYTGLLNDQQIAELASQ